MLSLKEILSGTDNPSPSTPIIASSSTTFESLNAQLIHSISQTDKATLGSILINMCKASPECLLQASKFLLVSTNPASANENNPPDGDDEHSAGHKRRRRNSDDETQLAINGKSKLVARYETCQNCHKLFDVGNNHDQACVTHDGELGDTGEWDELDHIEGNFDYDEDDRIEEFPEYFPWDCCNKPANAEGCVIQRHRI